MNIEHEVVLTLQTIFVGLIRTSSIGDVVISTTALNFLKIAEQQLTNTCFKVLFITRKPCSELLRRSHPELQIVDMDSFKTDDELVNQLIGLDLLIDLQVNPRSKMWCRKFKRKTGKPTIYAQKNRWQRLKLVWDAFWRRRSHALPAAIMQSDIFQYRIVIDALNEGIAKLDFSQPSNTARLALEAARPILPMARVLGHTQGLPNSKTDWIAIAPGASYSAKKCPEAVFLQILREFSESIPLHLLPQLVFLGDEKDTRSTQLIIKELIWPTEILDLSGKTTLAESTAILSQCKLILCNDSSLGHIAEAVGTPAGVLFGPTVEAFGFRPFKEHSRSFSIPLGCRPCSRHGSAPCRFKDYLCFTSLNTGDIILWLQGLTISPHKNMALNFEKSIDGQKGHPL